MAVRGNLRKFGVLDWSSMPVGLDFRALPVTLTQSVGFRDSLKYFILGLMGLAMFILLGAYTLSLLRDGPVESLDGWIAVLNICLVVLLMAFAAVLFISLSVINAAKRRCVRFDEAGVVVKERDLFRKMEWAIRYADFEGVLFRKTQVTVPFGFADFQVIELYHQDPAKSVSLYVQASSEFPRQRWKQYARRFKLPAILESDDGMIVLSLDELDKTVPDRARTIERIPVLQDNPPPKEITIVQGHIMGDAADVLRLRPRKSLWLAVIYGVVSLLGVAWSLIRGGEPDWVLGIISVGFFGSSVWLLYNWYWRPLEISVSRTRIKFGSVDVGEYMFPLKDIEDVLIRSVAGGSAQEALIAIGRNAAAKEVVLSTGDGAANTICNNLSLESLQWLRDHILAAAARG